MSKQYMSFSPRISPHLQFWWVLYFMRMLWQSIHLRNKNIWRQTWEVYRRSRERSLLPIAEHHQKTSQNPDVDNMKVLCRENKLIPRKVREFISVKYSWRKTPVPTYFFFWKHRNQECHLRQVSEEASSVAIQLPAVENEDGDGYHRNIQSINHIERARRKQNGQISDWSLLFR